MAEMKERRKQAFKDFENGMRDLYHHASAEYKGKVIPPQDAQAFDAILKHTKEYIPGLIKAMDEFDTAVSQKDISEDTKREIIKKMGQLFSPIRGMHFILSDVGTVHSIVREVEGQITPVILSLADMEKELFEEEAKRPFTNLKKQLGL